VRSEATLGCTRERFFPVKGVQSCDSWILVRRSRKPVPVYGEFLFAVVLFPPRQGQFPARLFTTEEDASIALMAGEIEPGTSYKKGLPFDLYQDGRQHSTWSFTEVSLACKWHQESGAG